MLIVFAQLRGQARHVEVPDIVRDLEQMALGVERRIHSGWASPASVGCGLKENMAPTLTIPPTVLTAGNAHEPRQTPNKRRDGSGRAARSLQRAV